MDEFTPVSRRHYFRCVYKNVRKFANRELARLYGSRWSDDWRLNPTPGSIFGTDNETSHGGTHSLRIRFDDTRNLSEALVFQYVPVRPNTSYRFAAYMRAWGNYDGQRAKETTAHNRIPPYLGNPNQSIDPRPLLS
jgi:hypothetical protein